jgi:hypothetical protein
LRIAVNDLVELINRKENEIKPEDFGNKFLILVKVLEEYQKKGNFSLESLQ